MPLFIMNETRKKILIDSQKYYFQEAKNRILSNFGDIEKDAENFREEWLRNNACHFDDPADYYENAWDYSVEFYIRLNEMKRRTYLSVLSDMFFEWDKKLRKIHIDVSNTYFRSEKLEKAIWKQSFSELLDLFSVYGWNVNSKIREQLYKYSLVVNVFKHGEGTSFNELIKNYGELFEQGGLSFPRPDGLWVKDVDLNTLSDAIIHFWTDIPQELPDKDDYSVPHWFEKCFDN